MTAPDPREQTELFGHAGPAATLAAAAAGGRLAHAWLLTGPAGVGKATLAWRFARWLLAGAPAVPPGAPLLALPAAHPVFRRVAAGSHADLRALEPNTGDKGKKELLRIDDVRDAVRFLAHTAAEGGWRVVLVDGIERTDTQAVQNALLKTLEEPPPRAVLLLTTAQPDRLLPTIRSRCRRLDLAPLPDAAVTAALARWRPDLPEADRAALARLAGGAPGRSLTLAEAEGLRWQGAVDGVLRDQPAGDPARARTVAEGITAKRGDGTALVTFFELLRATLERALRDAGRGAQPAAWLAGRSLADWAALWDRLGRLAEETERLNLDRRQTVLTGLSWLPVR